MEKFINVIDTFTERTGRLLSYCILPMIVVVLYTAIMRYVFKSSVSWGFEAAIFLFGVASVGGGAFAHLHKSHVTVDAVTSQLPEKVRIVLAMFSQLFVICTMLVVAYLSCKWAYKSTLILERSIHGTEWNPHIWWFKWTVFISACLIILQSLSEMAKQILLLKKDKGD